ncbi:DivIVA domain-containing protein [Actinomadura rupiterrae]|uniref:DivIVA domain-containing protein n=1 Tax=Actinomadura rupiterrae TaxID=559627 RepID=UPI0020A33D8C|nr:DivIVA domain-containing protein [Actinomadura rupiterrae]MCP2339698.1 DivIVA domain-containing protein [Actinomadura rupiterrae]
MAATAEGFPVVMRGYHRVQVDELLGRVRAALDGSGPPLTADDVRQARFDVVMRGYDRRAVDALLQETVLELQAMAATSAAPRHRRPHIQPEWLVGWVHSVRFPRAIARQGYVMADVDAFLDRVIAGLRGTQPPVSARDVREATFRTARFNGAYDEQDVDRFLAQLAAALEQD